MAQKRPKAKELRLIYRRLVSPVVGARLTALADALQWYDGLRVYIAAKKNHVWTDEQAKSLVLSEKCRHLGIQTNQAGEKETALYKTLKIYETVFAQWHTVAVDKFYQLYESKKERLTQSQERLEGRYGSLLTVLAEALHPVNGLGNTVEIVVGDGMTEPRKYDPKMSQAVYSRVYMRDLKTVLRSQGLLAVLFQEIPLLARAAAISPDTKGGFAYDVPTHLKATWAMQKSILAYCRKAEAPKRLVRASHIAVQSVKQTSGRRGGFGVKGPRVAGMYIPGKPMATLYETLADNSWCSVHDLNTHLPQGYKGPMRRLRDDGKRTGRWVVEEQNGSYRMVMA